MHLEELRIISCNIGACVTNQLIEELLEMSTLAKLSLVRANLSDVSFSRLCYYVGNNRNLKELDISFNDLRPKRMKEFVDMLALDRKLVSVNMSWNSLMDRMPSTKKGNALGQFSQLSLLSMIPEEMDDMGSLHKSVQYTETLGPESTFLGKA